MARKSSSTAFGLAAIVAGAALFAAPGIGNTSAAGVPDQTNANAAGKVLIFAHRGGRRWAPENTLAAFRKAVAAGVDGVELDIHRCKSGELIVIHDDTVDRTTNGTGAVKDKTLAELKALDAGSKYSSEFKGERLPLLSEVLDAVNGKATINIEIKDLPTEYPGIDDELLKLLSGYKYQDKIIISSFDHQVLHRVHEKAPQFCLAMLDEANPFDIKHYAEKVGVRDWNPYFDCCRSDTVANAHRAHLRVFTWTVNDPAEWERLSKVGVDGIITDDPVGLLAWRQKNMQATTRIENSVSKSNS